VVIGKITTDKTHRAVTRRQLSFLFIDAVMAIIEAGRNNGGAFLLVILLAGRSVLLSMQE